MANLTTQPVPSHTVTVGQNILAEPINGTQDIFYYLENFPESVYRKSPETNLYKFMLSLMGPSGVGLVGKQIYEQRQTLEELGLSAEALDEFFGNPLGFARKFNEIYVTHQNPITPLIEQTMRSADSTFFARSVNYLSGARAGNTPLGIEKVAMAGLGYGAEVIENYKFLYDQHSDLPLGLPRYGQTLSTEEFIIIPQPEVSVTPTLNIKLVAASGGHISIGFGRSEQPTTIAVNDESWLPPNQQKLVTISPTASRLEVQEALEELPNIGKENVSVVGVAGNWYITFQNKIDTDNIGLLNIYNYMTKGTIYLTTYYGFVETNEESINVNSSDAYTMLSALNNTKPVDSIPTIYPNSGAFRRVFWKNVVGSSEYSEGVKFVTGLAAITWPTNQTKFWVRPSEEKQSLRINKDVQYGYQGWHNVSSVTASSVGVKVTENESKPVEVYEANAVLADYPEPLWVTSSNESENIELFIDGIYPIEYSSLPGMAPINFKQHFWISTEREGTEFLEIDLGTTQAVNYINFDITYNPIRVDVFYNALDSETERNYVPVTPVLPYNNVLTNVVSESPKASVELAFSNSLKQMVFTRQIKIQFTRASGFKGQIEVANLRLGRNIS